MAEKSITFKQLAKLFEAASEDGAMLLIHKPTERSFSCSECGGQGFGQTPASITHAKTCSSYRAP